ncbi:hypothetical protein GR157_30740 [Burkholderia sp. 4701]|nr:hypothetical protein [Burkholderia sp. 4701]MXN86205.1 hypothetical protein [Burkholderia sp. 4812]
MKPFKTGVTLSATVLLFYALCTLVWAALPEPFMNFMQALFHGLDFRRLQTSAPLSWWSAGCGLLARTERGRIGTMKSVPQSGSALDIPMVGRSKIGFVGGLDWTTKRGVMNIGEVAKSSGGKSLPCWRERGQANGHAARRGPE